jgi:hypothetical protein
MGTPGPRLLIEEVTSLDLEPLSQPKDLGTFALSQERALMLTPHMPPPLRVAAPTVGHYQRRG